MSELKIWVFRRSFSRMGTIVSVFSATDEEVEGVIGKDAYFGEALGKHSEITTTLTREDFSCLVDNRGGAMKARESCGCTDRMKRLVIGRSVFDAVISAAEHAAEDEEDFE